MDLEPTGRASTPPTASTRAVSLGERSTADLIQAIHSPGDEAYALDRARITLKLYYDPGMSDLDRAEMLEEYGRALRDFPRWAVAQAFDEWNRTQRRRPAPGDLVALSSAAVGRLAEEVARREKSELAALPPPREARVTPEAAREILERAGFTFKRMDFPSMPDLEEPVFNEERRAHLRSVMERLKATPIVRCDPEEGLT